MRQPFSFGRMSAEVIRKKLDNASVSFRQSLATRTRAELVQHTESLPGSERKSHALIAAYKVLFVNY